MDEDSGYPDFGHAVAILNKRSSYLPYLRIARICSVDNAQLLAWTELAN